MTRATTTSRIPVVGWDFLGRPTVGSLTTHATRTPRLLLRARGEVSEGVDQGVGGPEPPI